MAQDLKYKKPRKINPVSVTIVAVLSLAGYMVWQYFPLFLLKQEAYRTLEETGSKYAGKHSFYRADPKRMEKLRRKMNSELRVVGVSDNEMESWIETDGPEVRFGCIFSVKVKWPFEILEDQEFVYEQEHVVVDTTL
jgi:hypothetical protein